MMQMTGIKKIFIIALVIGILLETCEAGKTRGTGFLRGRCEPREKKKKCPPGSVEVSASNKPVAEMSQEKSSDESAIDEQLCCLKENWQNKDNYKTEGHSQFVPPVIKKEKNPPAEKKCPTDTLKNSKCRRKLSTPKEKKIDVGIYKRQKKRRRGFLFQ